MSFEFLRAYFNLVLYSIENQPAVCALEVHDAAVALSDAIILEARLAKVVVDITREYEVVALHIALAEL